jgi:transcriptional regulator with XRE-family HTH domain
MSQLSEKIRRIRKDNNLSQSKFAEVLDVHRGHISKIETGAANPSNYLLLEIAFSFNISFDWLMHDEGPMTLFWGSKELINLYKSGKVSLEQKSLFIIFELLLAELDKLLRIPECLGSDVFMLADSNVKPGDPIVMQIVENILNKLKTQDIKRPGRINDLNNLNENEKSAIKILRAVDENSLKDFYLFLASKADRLEKEKKEKLKDDIKILRKTSK